MSSASGWFSVMPWAMFFRTVVLPALAGDRIRPRWPLPTGAMRLMSRWVRFFWSISRSNISSGKTGTSESKCGPAAGELRIDPVDGVDPGQAPVPLLVLRGPALADDPVAGPQTESADDAGRDVDVVRATA